jgi:hypothetical protein
VRAVLDGASTIRVVRGEAHAAPELSVTIDAGAPVISMALDPTGRRLFAVVSRLGLDVVAWSTDTPGEPPVEIAAIASGLPPVPIAFPSDDVVVIGDGDDLLFVPLDDPTRATRRGGHDEPIRRIAADARLVVSLATSFQDVACDEVRVWTADGQPLGPIALPGRAVDLSIAADAAELRIERETGGSWRVALSADEWIAAARRIAGRELAAEEERRFGVDAWRASTQDRLDGP